MKALVKLAWPLIAALPSLRTLCAAKLQVTLSGASSEAHNLTNSASASQEALAECLEVPQSICLEGDNGQNFIVSAPVELPDLVLWYQFDKSLPVDESGLRHHLVDENKGLTPLASGPGILGRGGSAAFDGHAFRAAQSTDALDTQAFTITLWLYLLEDSVGGWRTIFSRGASAEELMPALLLWPDERRLHVRVSPHVDSHQGILDSKGLVPLRRWTHITVACTGSVLRLYINGLKDGEVILDSPPVATTGDLHLGRDPWRSGIRGYLDDFRWYTKELNPAEIKALTFPSLTGIGTNFVQLGCPLCTFTEAVRSCTGNTHLCSLQELFAGGYHTARVMGWLSSSPEVWYHNEEKTDLFDGVQKLGLCCEEP